MVSFFSSSEAEGFPSAVGRNHMRCNQFGMKLEGGRARQFPAQANAPGADVRATPLPGNVADCAPALFVVLLSSLAGTDLGHVVVFR